MPGRVWEQAFDVAVDQHGFITARDLTALGIDAAHLRKWRARGQIDRATHGVYRFPQVPATPLDPYAQATLWPAGRGVLSHHTALELHELCDVNPERIHVTVPAGYRPRRADGERYVVHHEDLRDTEVTWHDGVRIVTPAVAIRQGIDARVPTHLLRQALTAAKRHGRAPPEVLAGLTARLDATAQPAGTGHVGMR